MTTTHTPNPHTTTSQPESATAGERVELARYETQTGTRILVGQRIDGIVHIFDEPTGGDEPSYLVETHLESNSELRALIADYVSKAAQLGYAPMHGWF
jgi:hypothetical protein